ANEPGTDDGFERVAHGDRRGDNDRLVGEDVGEEGARPHGGPGARAKDDEDPKREAGGGPDGADLLGDERGKEPDLRRDDVHHSESGPLSNLLQRAAAHNAINCALPTTYYLLPTYYCQCVIPYIK